MTTPHRPPVCLLLVLTLIFAISLSVANRSEAARAKKRETAGKQPAAAEPAKQAPAGETITIKPEALKIEVALDGVLEATCVREIAVRPEAWPELSVLTAVAHGRRVSDGTVLVKFDSQKIELAIADLEAETKATKLAIRQAEAALTVLKTSAQHSLAAAKRSAAETAEDLSRFRNIDRPQALKDIDISVTNAENSLAYQMEELRQLEKMYAADDLTEETEEIILTRARNRVKYYQHGLRKTIAERDEFVDITLPRRAATLQQGTAASALALVGAKTSLPASVTEKTLSLEKLKTGLDRSHEKLARLRRDRDQLTVISPAEGIVYYGPSTRGKWPEVAALQKILRLGGAAKSNQVLMTIVCDGDLVIRTAVEEKDLAAVKPGATGTAVAKAFPNRTLNARLAQLSKVPFADGKYDATVELLDAATAKPLSAGMNCSVSITTYEKQNAILIPKSAVTISAASKVGKVRLVDADGKTEMRKVKLGRTVGDRTEVLSGLAAGEQIRSKYDE